MFKETPLSEHIKETYANEVYEDVKQAVERLKAKLIKEQKDFCQEGNFDEYYFNEDVFKRKIDKIFGEFK